MQLTVLTRMIDKLKNTVGHLEVALAESVVKVELLSELIDNKDKRIAELEGANPSQQGIQQVVQTSDEGDNL